MDSPPSCSLSATGPLSDFGSSGLGGSISSDSVRAQLAIEVNYTNIQTYISVCMIFTIVSTIINYKT